MYLGGSPGFSAPFEEPQSSRGYTTCPRGSNHVSKSRYINNTDQYLSDKLESIVAIQAELIDTKKGDGCADCLKLLSESLKNYTKTSRPDQTSSKSIGLKGGSNYHTKNPHVS